MNPSILVSWGKLEWRILSAGSDPRYDEARAILERGLSALGLRAAPADPARAGEGPAIILNAAGPTGNQGYAIRWGEDRVELFGDSEAALPFAAAGFVEALGVRMLSPRLERVADTENVGERILRAAPAFPSRVLVLPECLSPETAGSFGSWAIRRGFDSVCGPEAEYRLSGGKEAFESASRRIASSSRGPIAVADLDAGASALALYSLQAELARTGSDARLRVLLRAGGFPDFVDAFLGKGRGPAPFIVLDPGERCRAHALGDPDCERNAAIFGEKASRAAARWRDSGGALGLRLRYDDDRLFPAPCPPQTRLIAKDLEWAAGLGCSALEYVASARLPERPSINAWVFSSLAFPPPRAKGEAKSDPAEAARSAFFGAMLGKESSAVEVRETQAPVEELSEYYALLEEALAAAFDRGLGENAVEKVSLVPEGPPEGQARELIDSLPPSAIDPWDEALERQEDRAQALTEAYPKLDRCAELLRTMAEGGYGDALAETREEEAFRALESGIELSGVMRALYAEAKREGGSPSALAMLADGALSALGRRLAGLYAPEKVPEAARKFLMSAYRFRILGLYYVNARGPVAKLRAFAFRTFLSLGYDRLSHLDR